MAEPFLRLELQVPSQTRYLSLIGNIAEEVARKADGLGVDRESLAYELNLAVTEAVVNAIQHGAPADPAKTVRISVSIDESDLCIQVFDRGQGFELDADSRRNTSELEEHGRGIFLICSVMDSVEYRKADDGNVLEMRKHLHSEPHIMH